MKVKQKENKMQSLPNVINLESLDAKTLED